MMLNEIIFHVEDVTLPKKCQKRPNLICSCIQYKRMSKAFDDFCLMDAVRIPFTVEFLV